MFICLFLFTSETCTIFECEIKSNESFPGSIIFVLVAESVRRREKALILYYSHNNDLKALHQQRYLSKTGGERGEGCPLSLPVSVDISHGKVWLRSGLRGSSLSF